MDVGLLLLALAPYAGWCQAEGGVFYLLNKMFWLFEEISKAQGAERKADVWKIWGWKMYIIGTPGVIAFLLIKHHWIFAAFEAGGIPMMLYGIFVSKPGKVYAGSRLDYIVLALFTAAGIFYSLWEFGGVTTIPQVLEGVIVFAFFASLFLKLHKKPSAYLWLAAMHLSAGYLLFLDGFLLIVLQQVVSFAVVAASYIVAVSKRGAPPPR